MERIVVSREQDGWRLDKAVAELFPGMGLRGRRRLVEAGAVTVNGKARPAAYKVRAGEILEGVAMAPAETAFGPADVPVAVVSGEYAALVKPGGLHTASIGPGGGASLEDLLPAIFPDRAPILLSRLDRLTSGLVPVAFSPWAAAAYRRLEDAGEVAKTYQAVVHGVVAEAFAVARELDVDDRAKTRVLDRDAADPLRHTLVSPVRVLAGLTLVECRIAKGARHQIRAHLAASGHPLVGDPLYGHGEGAHLYLHCAALACPVLAAQSDAPWTLDAAVRAVSRS